MPTPQVFLYINEVSFQSSFFPTQTSPVLSACPHSPALSSPLSPCPFCSPLPSTPSAPLRARPRGPPRTGGAPAEPGHGRPPSPSTSRGLPPAAPTLRAGGEHSGRRRSRSGDSHRCRCGGRREGEAPAREELPRPGQRPLQPRRSGARLPAAPPGTGVPGERAAPAGSPPLRRLRAWGLLPWVEGGMWWRTPGLGGGHASCSDWDGTVLRAVTGTGARFAPGEAQTGATTGSSPLRPPPPTTWRPPPLSAAARLRRPVTWCGRGQAESGKRAAV